MSSSDQNVSMLMEMGFESSRAEEALRVCDGNMERAVEFLFSGGTSGGAATMASSTGGGGVGSSEDVVASLSQYSVDNGRSACTCIALTAARNFLQNPSAAIQAQFLVDAIQQGVSNYQQLCNNNSSGGVEHKSAEEVLQAAASSTNTNPFAQLKMTAGGIRQGILSNTNTRSDMGLYTLLSACRQEAPSDAWLAVLITKTPETVLAILPPPSTQPQKYLVIDSHPRPGVVQGNGAYARIMSTLDDLVAHLSTILPATELGPDIPEMMAMMYNSFDLYPLLLST
ncbi:expressed unknown protein [Seminavis robusta]|uniref:UBA domain-containing protein n=1 Tax=Seminavis robusta TaxID=568900 RepID=A0A9N8DJH6_9STRA|nr:expressed unknown protein [Seminavis robusta]|eukprot:Sro176_g077240.1 n/a (284) ;mRNA; r:13589-14440